MSRLAALVLWALAVLPPGTAHAGTRACIEACHDAARKCVRAERTSYAGARSACHGRARAERRGCRHDARHLFKLGRVACLTSLRRDCVPCCRKGESTCSVVGRTTTTTTTTLAPAARFLDGGDGTITDLQTGLVWEKKDDDGGLHDRDNLYVWSGVCDQGETLDEVLCQPSQAASDACVAESGGAVGCRLCAGTCEISPFALATIWDWLAQVNQENGTGFAGRSDWRIPIAAAANGGDLGSLIDPSQTAPPLTFAAFDAPCPAGCAGAACSCAAPDFYWSSTQVEINTVRLVTFSSGSVTDLDKTSHYHVRAVHGGP